jgi:hypothetical protein
MAAPNRPRSTTSLTVPADYRPSYIAAAATATGILLLYLVTLAPSTAMWDTSEYIAAAYTLGIPHPPGNPLFVLLGRVFSLLPIASGVAARINILAALSSAIAAGMWFLIAERAVASWITEPWRRRLIGGVAALVGATAFTVWNQSVVNEKVYTVSLVAMALVSWLMVHWSDNPDSRGSDRLLVLVAYLLGLGYANHMAGMLPGPAIAVAVLVIRPRTVLRWRLLLACVGAVIIGLTPFATQPIRAAFHPAINEGEPTACRDGLKASCTFTKETWDRFKYNFDRKQYGKLPLTVRQAPFGAQLDMWWTYFRWQWLRDVYVEQPRWQGALGAMFLMLGLFGGYIHFRRDRRTFWYFGPLMGLMTLALIFYLNFKYGASQAPELGDSIPREVRDRDYFYLWSFSAWGIWVALGLAATWETIAAAAAERVPSRRTALAIGAPVLALALVPLFTNWRTASRRTDNTTSAFAHDLLNSVEPYGVLITAGDNDTFPLWYAQEVEGIRKDVTVAVLSLMNTDWFVRGIIRRPIHEYDAAKGPAVYRERQWTKPTIPILNLTIDEADNIPEYMVVRQPLLFRKGELAATLDPKALPNDGSGTAYLERSDLVALRIISDTWPQRPIYISRTAGDYARRIGLAEHTMTQGLARKLIMPPAASSRDTVYVAGDGWFDVTRSDRLWREVFRGPKAMIERGEWIDPPSGNIPLAYVFTGAELAQVLDMRGDTAKARGIVDTVVRVARNVRQDALVTQLMAVMGRGAAPGNDESRRLPAPVVPSEPVRP